MSDETTLLPCPFCGGEAKIMCMDLDSIEEGWKVWGVWCVPDLHAEEHDGYQHGHYIDNYATKEEAIEAWNTRTEQGSERVRECRVMMLGDCSECGSPLDFVKHLDITKVYVRVNYCPNCGARVKDGMK